MLALGRARSRRQGPVSASHLVVIRTISPTQPAPPGGFLYVLPNDNRLDPSTEPGIDHLFVFPGDCVLTRVHLHGDAESIGSVNTLSGGSHPIDLYVDGEFTRRLLAIPPGASTVDVSVCPDVAIASGAEVRFVVQVDRFATGGLRNFLFAFSIG